jgi:hypothetical protein
VRRTLTLVGDTPARVAVGILLDREPDEISEWLADAAAFDAGGADALWLDAGPAPDWDVLALAAALAVVTFRSRLVVALPAFGAAPAGRTLDTIGRLSHNRLALVADGEPPAGVAVFRRVPGGFESGGERWVTTPAPQGRAAWRAACVDAAGRGVRGLVVPADPRLLDILRNPDDPDDRRDLQLAQG